MPVYQYTVKGTPYHTIDLGTQLQPLLDSLALSAEIREMKNGFVLEIRGEENAFQKLEPELLKTLTEHINIQSYAKREYNRRQKRFTPKNFIDTEKTEDDIKKAVRLLGRGQIIALQTPRGFHILCNATKTNSIKTLRKMLNQPTKPLPVIFKNLLSVEKQVLLSPKEKTLLTSEEHPFVIAKKRNLHRLEKERYKATLLSLHINPLNRRITVALPPSASYRKLYEEINFPIISVEATDSRGESIRSEEMLLENYGEQFKYILNMHLNETQPPRKTVYQIVYGVPKRIVPPHEPETTEESITVTLDSQQSDIAGYKLSPLKILLDENGQEQPALSALSLLFSRLPKEEILALSLPFDKTEIEALYERWKESRNTAQSTSLLTLFDAIASLSGELHEKHFDEESLQVAEGYFEVCEEDLFDYTIENGTITIDIFSEYLINSNLKHLASTLVNTVSTIVAEIAQEKRKDVTLKGNLFDFRDLTELTIEKLEEADLRYFY